MHFCVVPNWFPAIASIIMQLCKRPSVQEEGMRVKIGILHWMSLPNTPILWTISVINCTILPQEICVIGARMKGQFISHLTDGFYQIIWNQDEVLGGNVDHWISVTNGAGPRISISISTLCHQSVIGEHRSFCNGSKPLLVHKLGVVQQWSTCHGMLK